MRDIGRVSLRLTFDNSDLSNGTAFLSSARTRNSSFCAIHFQMEKSHAMTRLDTVEIFNSVSHPLNFLMLWTRVPLSHVEKRDHIA